MLYVVTSTNDLWIPEVFDSLPQAVDSMNAYLMENHLDSKVHERVFVEYDENETAVDLTIEFYVNDNGENVNYIISPAIVNKRYNAED